MDFLDEMRSAYRTAIKGKWKNLPQEILIHKAKIMFPMTTGGDTAMHLAVYSRKEEPTKSLLAATSEVEREFWTNSAGNTPLHEAAAVGNLAAVKLLVEYKKEDLLAQNIYGETPLFRAVRFGHLHIVEYILEDCEDYFSRSPINWTKEKEFPIIHAAIQSEKFDVVLRLVDFDKSLLEMKDEDGKTALYVLANMPLIFRSGSSMGSLEKIIYAVLPSEDIYKYNFKTFGSSNKDDSESSGALNNKKNEDLEAQHNPDYGLNFCRSNCWKYFVHFLTCYFWRFIFLGWPQWKQLYRKKQHHKLAVTITKMLAEIDYSWRNTDSTPEINEIDYGARRGERKQIEEGSLLINKIQTEEDDKSKSKDIDYDDIHETPLLLAAANGIIEIVEAIVDAHPPAID
ncbi:uncharacterized protein LOC111012667, partial [Momordica charantia]|uniref:Uncharacterized protein LOC111012667 n=1 Tax=Momordica charantia TaxID=3673 RepID=A0A6J1CLX1_MOMCH